MPEPVDVPTPCTCPRWVYIGSTYPPMERQPSDPHEPACPLAPVSSHAGDNVISDEIAAGAPRERTRVRPAPAAVTPLGRVALAAEKHLSDFDVVMNVKAEARGVAAAALAALTGPDVVEGLARALGDSLHDDGTSDATLRHLARVALAHLRGEA